MKLRSILVLALTLACAPALAQVTPGTSPLSIAKGGTNASTAATAAANLGAPSRPNAHPASGNIVGAGCITAEAHSLWWVDQNLCSTADVWQITSTDPSAGFSLNITGTVTTGDAISLTITMGSGPCSGAGCTVTTGAATGGDNLGTMSGKLACAIANNASLFSLNGATCSGGVVSPAVPGTPWGGYASANPIGFVVINGNGIAFDFNSAISLKVTSSVSGSATEIVTINNTTCSTRCSYPLDNNPATIFFRIPGYAPQPGSTIGPSIYANSATSACPTSSCLNYAAMSPWIGNSTAGSLQAGWLLSTTSPAGALTGGWWFSRGLYANIGCTQPFGSGGAGCVQDKGDGAINVPAQDYATNAGYWIDGSDRIYRSAGGGQFVISAPSDSIVLTSSGAGVGINATPTGTTFTSSLGAFVSGTQVPTIGSGWSLQGGATPVLAAKNYATSAWLATSQQALSFDFMPSGSATSGWSLSANVLAPDADNATTLGSGSKSPSTTYTHALTASGTVLFTGGSFFIRNTTQDAFQFQSAAGTGGFLIGRSLANNDANDFFIYDAAVPAPRLTISNTGVTTFPSGVASTSSTTGTVLVTGGLGVSGAIYGGAEIGATTAYKIGTKVAWSATAPTVSSGFCTSPSISNNNGTAAFTVTIGSACAASTGVLTMPTASVGWACNFRNVTNNATSAPSQTASTVTSVSVTNYVRTTGVAGNWTASDVIVADCTAY